MERYDIQVSRSKCQLNGRAAPNQRRRARSTRTHAGRRGRAPIRGARRHRRVSSVHAPAGQDGDAPQVVAVGAAERPRREQRAGRGGVSHSAVGGRRHAGARHRCKTQHRAAWTTLDQTPAAEAKKKKQRKKKQKQERRRRRRRRRRTATTTKTPKHSAPARWPKSHSPTHVGAATLQPDVPAVVPSLPALVPTQRLSAAPVSVYPGAHVKVAVSPKLPVPDKATKPFVGATAALHATAARSTHNHAGQSPLIRTTHTGQSPRNVKAHTTNTQPATKTLSPAPLVHTHARNHTRTAPPARSTVCQTHARASRRNTPTPLTYVGTSAPPEPSPSHPAGHPDRRHRCPCTCGSQTPSA